MKVRVSRSHNVRPVDYESIMLHGSIEIDTESEADAEFRDKSFSEIGDELSAQLDELLDTDVDRALRSDGPYINDTHLWVFYEKE